jgi:hypothetical protein
MAPTTFIAPPRQLLLGDGRSLAVTPLTSIDLMARRSLKDDMPGIMLRATVRASTSAALQYQAQQHSDKQAGAAAALGALALTAFLQGADDRTWRTLPGEVLIARVRLPPGVHEVALQTYAGEQVARVDISGRYAVIDFRLLSGRLYVNAPKGRS